MKRNLNYRMLAAVLLGIIAGGATLAMPLGFFGLSFLVPFLFPGILVAMGSQTMSMRSLWR